MHTSGPEMNLGGRLQQKLQFYPCNDVKVGVIFGLVDNAYKSWGRKMR